MIEVGHLQRQALVVILAARAPRNKLERASQEAAFCSPLGEHQSHQAGAQQDDACSGHSKKRV